MIHALTRDDLVSAYLSSGKPRSRWLVGAEFERHLLHRRDGMPLAYSGEPGIRWLLERLAEAKGELISEADHPVAILRQGASVTLEPGGQLELSGSAGGALEGIASEAEAFSREVGALLEGSDVAQVALGYTPYATMAQIGWVPKGRYAIMRSHLAQTGALAHDMMKGTAAVQATYDYADETDCARKVGLATRLGPLTTAMFANSPYRQGHPSGAMSFRGHIWTQTDPARTGLPSAVESFSFEAWLDYLLDVPMMFKKDREGRWLSARGQTFRGWLRDPEQPPTMSDWDLHLTSVFPEVRVKHTIEVRGADCVPLPLAMSFVSLFKGLFYCELALEGATELAERFTTHGDRQQRFAVACAEGLEGQVGGRSLAAWAEDLLDLADAALQRCAPEDRGWLRPLVAQVETGHSPARDLLEALGPEPSPGDLIAHTQICG
ncbi:MAG TPA: glutamate--cysteine ligase [Deltaproteobacteria bacterium]|nr:glutamate--cysteine ligase [Deltaproteobacteria bacterium]